MKWAVRMFVFVAAMVIGFAAAMVFNGLVVGTACAQESNKTMKIRPPELPVAALRESGVPLNCPGLKAKYELVVNELYSEKIRHAELYLEPKAFNVKNLRKLFTCLSKANPEPVWLTATVETDWSRLPDMSKTGGGNGMSNMPPDPHEYDYLKALYWRRENREYFKYSPDIHVEQYYFKIVMIRGKDRK